MESASDSVIRWFKSSYPSHRLGRASFERKQFLLLSFLFAPAQALSRKSRGFARVLFSGFLLAYSGVSTQGLSIKPVLFLYLPRLFCVNTTGFVKVLLSGLLEGFIYSATMLSSFERALKDRGEDSGVNPHFFVTQGAPSGLCLRAVQSPRKFLLGHAEVIGRNSYADMLSMQARLAPVVLSHAAWRVHVALRKYFATFQGHTFFVKSEPSSVLPLFVRHGICAVSGSVKYSVTVA